MEEGICPTEEGNLSRRRGKSIPLKKKICTIKEENLSHGGRKSVPQKKKICTIKEENLSHGGRKSVPQKKKKICPAEGENLNSHTSYLRAATMPCNPL